MRRLCLLCLAGCASTQSQLVYEQTLAEVEQRPLDGDATRARLLGLEGVHRTPAGWPKLRVDRHADDRGDVFDVYDAFERIEVQVILSDAGEGRVAAACNDGSVRGACARWIWPLLYGEDFGDVEEQATNAQRAQLAGELDRRVEEDAEWDAQERAFAPYWGPLLGVGAELGGGTGGVVAAAHMRAGVRRFHGSFWSSGVALQFGASTGVVAAGTFAWQLSLPVRVELDYFRDHRFSRSRGVLPPLAAYAFVMPTLAWGKQGVGGGWGVGIGGQGILSLPIFIEVAFEDVRQQRHHSAGARFSFGFAL